jgi:hypothetical protein
MILVLGHPFLQGRSMPPQPPPTLHSYQLPGKRPKVAPECLLYRRRAELISNATTVEKPYLCETGLSGSKYLNEHGIMELNHG